MTGRTESEHNQSAFGWIATRKPSGRACLGQHPTLSLDVVLASGDVAPAQPLQATRTVPIAFVIVPDPIGAGLVKHLMLR